MACLAWAPAWAQTGSLAPAALAFGDQTVTTASAPRTITIANTSATAAFTVNTLTTSDPARFPTVGGSCGAPPFMLAAGASCTVDMAFAPITVGGMFGSFSVSATSPSATFTPASVSLSGNGVPIPGVYSPDALAFAETRAGVTSAPQSIAIGNADLQASLMVTQLIASSPTRFLVLPGGTCPDPPFAIAPGGMCTVHIAFRGVLPPGLVVGTFSVATAVGSAFTPTNVGLSGIGGPDDLFRDGFEEP